MRVGLDSLAETDTLARGLAGDSQKNLTRIYL